MTTNLTLCNNCLWLGARPVDVGPEQGTQRDPYRAKLMLCDDCKAALLGGDLVSFHRRFSPSREITQPLAESAAED